MDWTDVVTRWTHSYRIKKRVPITDHIMHDTPISWHAYCVAHDVTVEIAEAQAQTINDTQFCMKCRNNEPAITRKPDPLASMLRSLLQQKCKREDTMKQPGMWIAYCTAVRIKDGVKHDVIIPSRACMSKGCAMTNIGQRLNETFPATSFKKIEVVLVQKMTWAEIEYALDGYLGSDDDNDGGGGDEPDDLNPAPEVPELFARLIDGLEL